MIAAARPSESPATPAKEDAGDAGATKPSTSANACTAVDGALL
eukprot:CAMPEP_0115087944 /NCGR_PEP_ID=MMETSP0227-20121206/23664_1 /TAXON_ID=89957 /ORGANISM="Polarella glacialis, Strain CCMP 1383" /LENGTH=42 /DNA_ID= /DNA_START= /DNA_END= /DNA_ORIENTATION=